MTQYIGIGRYQKGQTKAVSGTTATFTNPVGPGVYKVMLSATVDICFVQSETLPLTATTSDTVIYASTPLHILVMPGESVAIIARDGTSTGTAYMSEVA